jgi:hypothetical protein
VTAGQATIDKIHDECIRWQNMKDAQVAKQLEQRKQIYFITTVGFLFQKILINRQMRFQIDGTGKSFN